MQQLAWEVMISQNVKDAVETAIMNIIEDVITNDIEEEERQMKRVRQETPNCWDSTWGRMLLDPNFSDSDFFAAKKFRRRFRVPYPLFSDVIVPDLVNSLGFILERFLTLTEGFVSAKYNTYCVISVEIDFSDFQHRSNLTSSAPPSLSCIGFRYWLLLRNLTSSLVLLIQLGGV